MRVGTEIAVSSSPSWTSVSYTPTKKSSAETTRSPPVPRIVIDAPSATSSGGKWLVGSLTQMLPPSVPRLRTWTSATVRPTSARIGLATSTSDEAISRRHGHHRPDLERALVGGEADRLELVEAAQVDEHVGRGGPLFHHVDERLATGEGTRPVVLAEEAHRLLDGGRTRVGDLA